nr:CP100k-like protein 1 [Tetraclita japonica formosana]
MMRVPLALTLLLAAFASGSIMFPRNGCGCLRNPVAAELKTEEITQLRGYIKQRGVTHYEAFTDYSLQAIYRFNLLNNFPDVVPSSRSGVIQVVSESLKELTDEVVPSAPTCGKIADYLQGAVPELAGGGVNIDLKSLVAASAVILHQRGVAIQLSQLNILLKTGLSGYLQSTAYKTSYSALSQLIATLDHIDHNLPNILDQDLLIAVRRKLETRFNLDSKIFDQRFQQAIRVFEANRQRILESFNSLAFRGPDYEVTIQVVIRETIRLFPGISKTTLRSVLNILQLTNTRGGKATPKDLLAMITIPHLDKSLRTITDVIANRIFLKLPYHHKGLTRVEVHEAYVLFIIGLASQGVQPVQLQACHEAFVWHTQRFFLGTRSYTVEAYILYVIRVVVPSIPRGSVGFRLHLFDASIVIDNVLVPEPLQSIYKEGRQTIIERVRGLQGSSEDITRRLLTGEGEKPFVKNIVDLRPPIKTGPLPTYSKFEYEGVILSVAHLQAIAYELQRRFDQLKQPQLQLPLLRVLIRAHVVRGSGDKAAAAFRRLFSGLPRYVAPQDVAGIITQLSERRLQLTRTQVLAGLQQFFVASRCLGHVIPPKSLPGVFVYTITQYIQTLSKIPAQPFDYRFLQYLYQRLASIIQQVVLINRSVPVVGRQVESIFSVFGRVRISLRCQRTIVRFIDNSGLIKRPMKGSSTAVVVYRQLLATMLKRYPVGVFVLSEKELTILRVELSTKYRISITTQYLRDANIMSFVGLGLLGRLKPSLTVVQYRQVLVVSIRSFLRINKVSNIPTSDYFRVLFRTQHVKTPSLPVPQPPVIQTPKVYVPPPIYILRGLTLTVVQVREIVAVLRVRFTFVSLDNVQAILAHTVLLLRANGKPVDQKNAYEVLSSYYSSLSKNLAISGVDIDALLKTIDERLVDATISGTGIQSGLVELFLHMSFLKMPIPGPEVRNEFFSFCIGAYGQVQVRRQLPFGKSFYEFLSGFLPKLPGYLKPFPLFSGPKIFDAFSAQLKTRIAPSDIRLLIQVIRRTTRVKSSSFNLGYLLKIISRAKPTPITAPLDPKELTGLLDYVKAQKLKVTQAELTRAFAICRLTVRLSVRKVTRVQVLKIFQRLVQTTVKKYNSLLVVSLVEQLVVSFRSVKVIRPVIPFPRPTRFPVKRAGGFFD